MQAKILQVIGEGGVFPYVLVFLTAGLLSLGSCTLTRIPIVVGYIGGFAHRRTYALKLLLGFILGLFLSYTGLGILLGKVSGFVTKSVNFSYYFYFFAGIILVFLGINLLELFSKFKLISFPACARIRKEKLNFFLAVILGIVFAFFEAPVCPCCGPMLFLISTNVIASGNFFYALSIFITYAAGQSFPLLVIGLSSASLAYIERVQRIEPCIKLGAGVVLFYFGLYLLWLA